MSRLNTFELQRLRFGLLESQPLQPLHSNFTKALGLFQMKADGIEAMDRVLATDSVLITPDSRAPLTPCACHVQKTRDI